MWVLAVQHFTLHTAPHHPAKVSVKPPCTFLDLLCAAPTALVLCLTNWSHHTTTFPKSDPSVFYTETAMLSLVFLFLCRSGKWHQAECRWLCTSHLFSSIQRAHSCTAYAFPGQKTVASNILSNFLVVYR